MDTEEQKAPRARRSAGQIALTLADQALVSGLNFVTSVAIGRWGAPGELGQYLLGFTVLIFLTNSQHGLITSPYQVFFPRKHGEDARNFSGSILLHQVAFTLLSILLLLFAAGTARLSGSADVTRLLLVLAAGAWFMLLKDWARQVCFARLHVGPALLLDAAASLGCLAGLWWLARQNTLTAVRVFAQLGFFSGVGGLCWLLAQRGSFRPTWRGALIDFWHNWRFSKWIFLTIAAYAASMQLYPWMLAALHGEADTDLYAACSSVVFLANPFLLGMSNYLGPKAAHAFERHGAAGVRAVVRKSVWLLGGVMLLFLLGMAALGPRALHLFFGEKFSAEPAAWGVMLALTCSQGVWALMIPVNFALNAFERPQVAFFGFLMATACSLTLGVGLVYGLGAVGVSLGMFFANLTTCGYSWYHYHRHVRGIVL